jgi:hypothetical protein
MDKFNASGRTKKVIDAILLLLLLQGAGDRKAEGL